MRICLFLSNASAFETLNQFTQEFLTPEGLLTGTSHWLTDTLQMPCELAHHLDLPALNYELDLVTKATLFTDL